MKSILFGVLSVFALVVGISSLMWFMQNKKAYKPVGSDMIICFEDDRQTYYADHAFVVEQSPGKLLVQRELDGPFEHPIGKCSVRTVLDAK